MTKEEKAALADRLRDRGWRLTDEIEYTAFFLQMMKITDEKKKKERQEEIAAIISDMKLGRCFMVPIDFKDKEEKWAGK